MAPEASPTKAGGVRLPAAKTPRASRMSTASSSISSVGTATSTKKGGMGVGSRNVSRSGPAKSAVKTVAGVGRVGATASNKGMVKLSSPVRKPISMPTSDNESIKAFLRIRPAAEEAGKTEEEPYIEIISETEVLMSPPKSSSAARARVHSTAVPTKYAFSRVFPGDAPSPFNSQSSFFKETALPLVDELMQGQSGLIFTYGVTNSGKSYTVQGGMGGGEAGILPRSMDTIFNSIKGLESTSDIRPVGLAGVERAKDEGAAAAGMNPFSLPGLSKKLPASSRPAVYEHDATKVKVDRNYRYSVWVSYVEVYNEKIFDLLDAAPPGSLSAARPSMFSGLTRSDSFRGSNWTLASLASDSGPICLQRRPLTLKNDVESGGKYVAGLQEIRVRSAAEARELLQRGQENRQVFGTMANRASSRSHGVFTVKIIREHAGETDLTIACSTSRLSIVDLAGSERLGNTSVTGDRLKEAGSINKSLMCLGQCLETLRKNQSRATSFAPSPALSTTAGQTSASSQAMGAGRLMKRRPSIVPFRHSKLTELFQSFFTGEGRAVMIVNVNPFDTGFDENSHVMRFSAAAKEVQTIRNQSQTTSLSRFVHPSLRDLFQPGASPAPSPVASKMAPPGKATMAGKREAAPPPPPGAKAGKTKTGAGAAASKEEMASQEVTIVEEEGNEEDDEADSFVDHLMAKYEEVRHRLYQSERQCALIEASVREEMAEEMSRRLQEMESIFNSRIVQDSSLHDDFVNRKLDLFGTVRASKKGSRADEEDEVEDSLPSRAALLDDQSIASVDDSEEEGVRPALPRNKAGTKRPAESESEEENSVVEHGDSAAADESGQVSSNDGEGAPEETTLDDFLSSEAEDEEESDDESDESESEDSDDSFEASKESIESSFEAAPKRTSRGRASKVTATKKPASRAAPTAAVSQKRPAAASRKSTNGLPLGQKSANESVEGGDQASDASLVLSEKTAKSPKKKRLLSKKAAFDQEDLMDEIGCE